MPDLQKILNTMRNNGTSALVWDTEIGEKVSIWYNGNAPDQTELLYVLAVVMTDYERGE